MTACPRHPRAYASPCTTGMLAWGANTSESEVPTRTAQALNSIPTAQPPEPPLSSEILCFTMGFELWSEFIPDFNRFQGNFIIIVSVLLGGYLGYLLYYAFLVCPTRHIPGPFLTRFTYAPYYFLLFRGRACMDTMALHQKYGTSPLTLVRVTPALTRRPCRSTCPRYR
jgi:hypothetical protein